MASRRAVRDSQTQAVAMVPLAPSPWPVWLWLREGGRPRVARQEVSLPGPQRTGSSGLSWRVKAAQQDGGGGAPSPHADRKC